jgi:hypothetical protein
MVAAIVVVVTIVDAAGGSIRAGQDVQQCNVQSLFNV